MWFDVSTSPVSVFADAGVTAMVGVLLVGVIGFFFSLYMASRARRRERQLQVEARLDEKLARVVSLSRELSALNSEVQAEFALQIAATEKAKLEAEKAEALAALSEAQRVAAAEMVRSQLDAALSTSGKKDRAFQVWLSIGSFIAGVVVTLVLGLLGVGG